MEAATLRTRDHLGLHWRCWGPPAAQALRGRVLVVHGLGEHIARYDEVAHALTADGWQVHGYDQRGHGRSPGPRGGLRADDDLLADLGAAITKVRAEAPAGPLVLLGHSMGGAVAARFVAEGLQPVPAPWWQRVDALVLSSPALDPGLSAVQRGLIGLLAPLLPGLPAPNGLQPDWVSRDPTVVAAYRADPLVHGRITPRLARFIVQAGAAVRAAAAQWTVPTLLLYAGADRCVSPRGSEAFAAAAPGRCLTVHRHPGLYHEVFNEPERAEVLAQLRAWLAALR